MLRIFSLLCGLMLCSAPAFACEMASDERKTDVVNYVSNGLVCLAEPPATFRFDGELEKLFERAINQERETRGLDRLKLRADIRPAARFHSLDMGVNEFFAHESPAGLAHDARIAAFDRTLLSDRSAENVAQFGPAICTDQNDREVSCLLAPGFELPTRAMVVDQLHRQLMDSKGHRENILQPDVTHMAVGVARTDTGFYVTQLFVSVAGVLETPAPLLVKAGQKLDLEPRVEGWDSLTYAISTDDDPIELERARIPRDASGDVSLNIRAERIVETKEDGRARQSLFWMFLSGPKLTVSPTKES